PSVILCSRVTCLRGLRSFPTRRSSDLAETGSAVLEGPQVRQVVGGDRILGADQGSPDRGGDGDGRVVGREGFNAQRTGVCDVVERLDDLRPGQGVRAGGTSVVGADLDMGAPTAGAANRRW